MRGGSSTILLYIFFLSLLIGEGVFSLHCHRCDSIHHKQCNNELTNSKYLSRCRPGFRYCGISRLGNSTRRGCLSAPLCSRMGDPDLDICCYCKTNGCNWTYGCSLGYQIVSDGFKIFTSSYFCYDNPGALQDVFKEELNITTTEFTLIYSIYSWPNVVLCFVGGFLIDRVFGIRLGTNIYLVILLLGQLLFAGGGISKTFWLMIVGRFVFGVGAESLAVAQNNYAVLWFKGKELNMVFGLQLSIARLGSTVNFWVMQPIYDYVQQYYPENAIGIVMFLSASTCVFSLLCALILGWMDKRAERILHRDNNPGGEIAKISDITTFKITFWMVSVICVAYYVCIFPFIALGKGFFMDKFNLSPDEANNVNSVLYLISAVASPLFGFIVDKSGRNVNWIFLAISTTMVAHSILAFTMLNPYVGMVIMGLSYSVLASSLWPLVSLIVPDYQLGTAYGFCQAVQNLGLAIVTILSGLIVDKSDGDYMWLEIFYLGWLAICFLATTVIYIYDRKTEGNLNRKPIKK